MATLPAPRLASNGLAANTPVGAVRGILRCIDDLPQGAVGALEFEEGCLLVENRKVCWAASKRLRQRLTDILRHQADPPLDPRRIEEIVQSCRGTTLPIGEALVKSGLITEKQLGASLQQHITESICMLAQTGDTPRWAPRKTARYDARFTFSTVQVLCSVGALRVPETSSAARAFLRSELVPEARAISFVRDPGSATPLLLAESRCDPFTTDSIIALCEWSMGLFDVSGSITNDVRLVIATWRAGAVVTAWQSNETTHLAICEGPSFAMLATRLSDTRLVSAARLTSETSLRPTPI